jgi:hypothetical protein
MSHTPPEARHSVDAGSTSSAGQLTPTPLQFSTMSQIPPEARHTVDDIVHRTGHVGAVAVLGDVAISGFDSTYGRRRVPLVERAVNVHSVAVLDDVAGTSRWTTHRGSRLAVVLAHSRQAGVGIVASRIRGIAAGRAVGLL